MVKIIFLDTRRTAFNQMKHRVCSCLFIFQIWKADTYRSTRQACISFNSRMHVFVYLYCEEHNWKSGKVSLYCIEQFICSDDAFFSLIFEITWIQRVCEFLHEISEPDGDSDHGEADQLYRKMEGGFLWSRCRVRQCHHKEATPQDEKCACYLHFLDAV